MRRAGLVFLCCCGPPLRPPEVVDAAPPLDAGVPDAAPRCDPVAPFGAPRQVIWWDSQRIHSLSRDELTAYAGTVDEPHDLYVATRAARDALFSAPQPLAVGSPQTSDEDPFIAPDGLSLLFTSDWGSLPTRRIFVARRDTTASAFSAPVLVSGIEAAHASDRSPYLAGGALWFESNRDGGGYRIYRAAPVGDGFADAMPQLPPGYTHPVVSADELTLFVTTAELDIAWAHRASRDEPFAEPLPLVDVNTAAAEAAVWISEDRCRLYFTSDGSGITHTHVIEREGS